MDRVSQLLHGVHTGVVTMTGMESRTSSFGSEVTANVQSEYIYHAFPVTLEITKPKLTGSLGCKLLDKCYRYTGSTAQVLQACSSTDRW